MIAQTKPVQNVLPLEDAPLPGTMMPHAEQENLVPKKVTVANDRLSKPKPHYSDAADKDQTIPI